MENFACLPKIKKTTTTIFLIKLFFHSKKKKKEPKLANNFNNNLPSSGIIPAKNTFGWLAVAVVDGGATGAARRS